MSDIAAELVGIRSVLASIGGMLAGIMACLLFIFWALIFRGGKHGG